MYQNNYFVVSVKINFCQRQTKWIDDQDKFQSFKDGDNEFTECLGQVTKGNARTIENSIIFRTNPSSYLGTL